MGYKSSEWAYSVKIPDGPQASAQRAVLAALAHCRNDSSGKCNPGHTRLETMTDLSRATVKRALIGLEEMGLLARVGVFKDRQRVGTNYDLRRDLTEPGSTVTPAHDEPTRVHGEPTSVQGDPTPGLIVDPPRVHGEPQIGIQESQELQEGNSLAIAWTDPFDEFYTAWPKKVDKPAARKAWPKALERAAADGASAHDIVNAATAYRDNPHLPDKQYIPYPATWLNRDGWNDELPGPRHSRDSAPTRNERNLALVAEIAQQEQATQRGISA
jgi:hypothetical protein